MSSAAGIGAFVDDGQVAVGPVHFLDAIDLRPAGTLSVELHAVEEAHRESAAWIRSLLSTSKQPSPALFREALTGVPPMQRDAWLDLILGLESFPDDGPELPRGCVPYLPSSVDALLRMVEHADVQASDVFVDIGSGVGRSSALVHLLTGASVIGLEIQPALVRASRDIMSRLNVGRVSAIEGDAVLLTGHVTVGSVFFLYCPFSGHRLETMLDNLEPIARTRQIRVCCVDLPLPFRSWLTLASPAFADLAIYRSNLSSGIDLAGQLVPGLVTGQVERPETLDGANPAPLLP